ncbi:hypothetical protein ZIOFF_060104 [Zingiber officinale]|uniref:Uncharacterized protein n=1 Tax=Zingiber officinale TaxID=94328 RepID=A0A8J5FAB5_ZINOF|nr:hypothetical protein ZIOFF_060104 [Zingiber officinale]
MSAPMITGCQRFIASPHAFSQDGKKLLILELEGGHNDRVTFVVVVPVASHLTEFIKKMKIQFPAHSMDDKKLLVCTGCTVSIFSASTGMQIMELEGGHIDRVTSVIIVLVASPSTELIKKVKIQFPVHSMGFIHRVAHPGGFVVEIFFNIGSKLGPNNLAELAKYAAFVLKGMAMG